MSLIRVIVAIGAAFVLWSPNVAAQETLAVGACMADAKSLCGATGGRELNLCGAASEISQASAYFLLPSCLRSTRRAGRTSTNSLRTSKSERDASKLPENCC